MADLEGKLDQQKKAAIPRELIEEGLSQNSLARILLAGTILETTWDKDRTGVIAHVIQPGDGTHAFTYSIGSQHGDPYPEVVPDPRYRKFLSYVSAAHRRAICQQLRMPDHLTEEMSRPQVLMETVDDFLIQAHRRDQMDQLKNLLLVATADDEEADKSEQSVVKFPVGTRVEITNPTLISFKNCFGTVTDLNGVNTRGVPLYWIKVEPKFTHDEKAPLIFLESELELAAEEKGETVAAE